MVEQECVEICYNCKGTGKQERSERYDYHHRYDHVWDEVCETCGGHGRLKKIVTTEYVKLTDKDLNLRPKPKDADS